jgi:uncharacterized membrane protein YcaP (DUF421 family)
VQNALVGGDNTLVGGLVSALTLLLMLAVYLAPQPLPAGEPVLLVSDSQVRWGRMRREGVTRDELVAALREQVSPASATSASPS